MRRKKGSQDTPGSRETKSSDVRYLLAGSAGTSGGTTPGTTCGTPGGAAPGTAGTAWAGGTKMPPPLGGKAGSGITRMAPPPPTPLMIVCDIGCRIGNVTGAPTRSVHVFL